MYDKSFFIKKNQRKRIIHVNGERQKEKVNVSVPSVHQSSVTEIWHAFHRYC